MNKINFTKFILISICAIILCIIKVNANDISHKYRVQEIVGISPDSLSNLLKTLFVSSPDSAAFKVSVTKSACDVNTLPDNYDKTFIDTNKQRYIAGDTLIFITKTQSDITEYVIHK